MRWGGSVQNSRHYAVYYGGGVKKFCKNIIKNSDTKGKSQRKLKGPRKVTMFLGILAEQHWSRLGYHGRHHNV